MTRKGGTIGAEAAENQLNVLIERRAREAQDANHAARVWAESLEGYNLAAAQERRQAWLRHHERMVSVHRGLAQEHQQAITTLLHGNW
jgi:hypothetical protein